MEQNAKLELVSKIVRETGCSLFLTGKAGTGKTTFLRQLRSCTHKRMIVTAPTGIAAINAGGMTLHSFFQLDFAPFVPGMQRSSRATKAFSKEKIKIIRGLDLLVIDEISMVRADVLDAVDDVLRRFRDRSRPFGGVQLLLIGDLQQLPPVVVESERHFIESNYRSPYFFDSHALSQLDYLTVELTKVYRQSDAAFIELLNAVRDNNADEEVLGRLNSRYRPGFNPDEKEGYIRLTTHNNTANAINKARLDAIAEEEYVFPAKVTGNFPVSSYPAEENLALKLGAQVMFIKNDGEGHRYFNGMMGKITEIDDKKVVVTPDEGSCAIEVNPVVWENIKFVVDDSNKEITQQVDGTFTQFPLKTAWAITIHKSQGLTFDKAIIDASGAFSHGQTYVALSRCRSLEGMVLERPLTSGAIINDPTVRGFMQQHTMQEISEESVSQMVHSYSLHLATEMFNFRPLFFALEALSKVYDDHFIGLFPHAVMDYTAYISRMRDMLLPVHGRFVNQIMQIDREIGESGDDSKIKQRIKDASKYFHGQLVEIMDRTLDMPREHDNKKVLSRLSERLELFESAAMVRLQLLNAFCEEEFDVSRYLELKAEFTLRRKEGEQKKSKGKTAKSGAAKSGKKKEEDMTPTVDNVNPVLYRKLRDWRNKRAEEDGTPPFVVLANKPLLNVANECPQTMVDLLATGGIGRVKAERYGQDILRLVAEYVESQDNS